MVYMRHPDLEATSDAQTREALDQVWRDKGWEEAPPPTVEDALAEGPPAHGGHADAGTGQDDPFGLRQHPLP